MTTITRRKALTVDALRERLKKAMAKPHERECTACSGSGRVVGPVSLAEVGEGAAVVQSALYAFLRKNKGLSLEAGLKVLDYVERLEDPLAELDDEEPRDPDDKERESARRRQLSAMAAAAAAAIDAINRPVQANGGVAAKTDRRLTLGQLHEVRRAMASGAQAPDLARAYDVSVRTIYRACEGEIEEGEVGGRKVVMQIVAGREPVILGRPEDELIRAHSRGDSPDPSHVPQPHELRNAWQTAKQLEDRLELADQPVLRRIARYLREQTFLELMALEGYVEVGDG